MAQKTRNVVPDILPSRVRWIPSVWENGVLYVAAFFCTILAVAAAHPRLHPGFAIALYVVTAVGFALSWRLRRGVRWRGVEVPRRAINSLIFVVSSVASLIYLRFTLPPYGPGEPLTNYLLRLDARPLDILIGVFLIVAVVRCLFILNEKDALYCTVPSFSVLLLLSVVHHEVSVLVYFVLWAVATSILLALDHRTETHAGLAGYVPAAEPGQDVTFSARSLLMIIVFSLACSVGLSFALANREDTGRSSLENWLVSWAGRFDPLSGAMETSNSAGPERTIDFSVGPSLPSRTALWRVSAFHLEKRNWLRPNYWRMFTLSYYDGTTWAQMARPENIPPDTMRPFSARVTSQEMPLREIWPLDNAATSGFEYFGKRLRRDTAVVQVYDFTAPNNEQRSGERRNPADVMPFGQFGEGRQLVALRLDSLATNSGFIPALPVISRFIPTASGQTAVRVRHDGSLEAGVTPERTMNFAFSEVSDEETGVGNGPTTDTLRAGNRNVNLTEVERQSYLQLPENLPRRVLDLAREKAGEPGRDHDLKRVRRLAAFVENNAEYTLRPPLVPSDRDATDYFLFDSKRGYCTYFAGALTVLCRAAGVPARVVSGFANPEWQMGSSGSAHGVIRAANAHAWTEVWIDGWGWTTLDATPADDRGDNAPSLFEGVGDTFKTSLSQTAQWMYRHTLVVQFLLLFALLGVRYASGGFASTRWKWGLARRGELPAEEQRRAIEQAYAHIERRLARRFRPRAPWETPDEWLAAVQSSHVVADVAPLRLLTALYTQSRYNPGPVENDAEQQAREALRQIKWKSRRS